MEMRTNKRNDELFMPPEYPFFKSGFCGNLGGKSFGM